VVAATKKKQPNAHKLAQAEGRVAELESRLHAIDMDLADPDVYSDGGTNAAELSRQRDVLAAQLAKAEEELLGLYDAA
jgi:ATP-binding cassette subfamily F protein 3